MQPEINPFVYLDRGRYDGASRELVVLLHAWTLGRDSLEAVEHVVRETKPHADIFRPQLPLRMVSREDPHAIAENLLRDVDALWNTSLEGNAYDQIILIGHSFGSILARKVFVLAHGVKADALRARTMPRHLARHGIKPWASRIRRLILLAGANRGWTETSALSPVDRMFFGLGTFVGRVIEGATGQRPTIFAIRRGAPFLTVLRLQWLALEDVLSEGEWPLIVQLLGTIDDFVSPADHIDLATGRNFVYLEVPHSGHLSVIHMGEPAAQQCIAYVERRQRFRDALLQTPEQLSLIALSLDDVADQVEAAPDDRDERELARRRPDVTDVVFVVHGIRDHGFWTKKVARDIKKLARSEGRVPRAVTSTYGYFPMLSFVLPWTRMAKVEWFLDQYVDARALYPNATFSFVGHSNGTYLLARALEMCSVIHFERVVFAGSVVRCRYDWTRFVPKQIGQVLNYVASADWVVALCTKGWETLRIQDLGSAGHDGFRGEVKNVVRDLEYVPGKHSAALSEDNWRDIAAFVVQGTWPQQPRLVPKRCMWVKMFGYGSPIALIFVPIFLVLPGVALLGSLSLSEAILALCFVLYVGILRVIFTRV